MHVEKEIIINKGERRAAKTRNVYGVQCITGNHSNGRSLLYLTVQPSGWCLGWGVFEICPGSVWKLKCLFLGGGGGGGGGVRRYNRNLSRGVEQITSLSRGSFTSLSPGG